MFRRIDRSETLIQLTERLSASLARRRGAGIVIGVVLIAIAFVLQLINVQADSTALEYAQIILHNLGIIIAFIFVLLVDPLG